MPSEKVGTCWHCKQVVPVKPKGPVFVMEQHPTMPILRNTCRGTGTEPLEPNGFRRVVF